MMARRFIRAAVSYQSSALQLRHGSLTLDTGFEFDNSPNIRLSAPATLLELETHKS